MWDCARNVGPGNSRRNTIDRFRYVGVDRRVLHYHGTDTATAAKLAADPASLDVSLGGGELGQGFYTTEHVAMAAAWARGRHRDGTVLEIDMNVEHYASLAVLTVNVAQVRTKWAELKRLRQTRLFRFGYDVVFGPFATYPHVTQHKFESIRAQQRLHESSWRAL
jgi:hypothetical protein